LKFLLFVFVINYSNFHSAKSNALFAIATIKRNPLTTAQPSIANGIPINPIKSKKDKSNNNKYNKDKTLLLVSGFIFKIYYLLRIRFKFNSEIIYFKAL
ncbi:MAG: hypothetical protein QQN63_02775, partial [Nitrosopumilus sp.]